MWFLGISLVDACLSTKTVCTNCDIDGTPSNCIATTDDNVTQEYCYNLHDGVNNCTTEYRVESSKCCYRRCFDPGIFYRENRIITMMTCLPGIANMA